MKPARLPGALAALPRDARDTLFQLAVIAWVLLPQALHVPAWCSALALGVLAWRGWIAASGRPLPGRLWVAGLLAAMLAGTLWSHHTLLGRDAGVTLIVGLLALKTLELRARRDAFVVFFLGLFTLLTNFFFSQSLPIALAMAVGLLGLLTALVNAHLPTGHPSLALSLRVAGRMALLGTPVMAALFLLFPRLPPLWGLPGDALVGRSGLSSQMQVGDLARVALDEGIALRLRFEGEPPARADLYLRGPVLANFDGRQWRPLYPSTPALPAPETIARRAPLQLAGEPVRYTLTLEPSPQAWLPLLDVSPQAPVVPGFEVMPTPELQWQLTRPLTERVRFAAQAWPRWRQGPFLSPSALPLEYRELPAGFNPRTLQMASDLMRASKAPPEDKGVLVEAALQQLRGGGYRYTLEPGVYGTHTADEFWFDRREGFCEHIASAFVVLMRGMDIPARVVTGYQGGELAPNGDWVLRNSDAHAWAEVWLAGRGWLRVDPTAAVAPARTGSLQRLQPPPGVLADAVNALSPTLLAGLRQAWETMNNAWNQRILNYTQGRQMDLLRALGFSEPDWEDLGRVLAALLVLVTAAATGWALWERSTRDPWLRLLERTRARLARRGLVLGPACGPRAMAQAVVQRFGDEGQPLARWLLRLEAQRYAAPGTDPTPSLAALARQSRHLPWPQDRSRR